MNRGHTILAADRVRAELASRFGAETLGDCADVRLWHAGTNDVYEVRSGDARRFLRVTPQGWRDAADVRWETALLRHVAGAGIAVALPVGEAFAIESPEGTRPAVLFAEAPGRPFRTRGDEPHAIEEARALGETLARFHTAAGGFAGDPERFPLDAGHLMDSPLAVIEAWPGRAAETARVRRLAERILPTIASPTLARGPLHGDLNGDNAHYADGIWTLFDFDCGGIGAWIYDLAVFCWACDRFGWPSAIWETFRSGYVALRPLTPEEEAALPAFVLARELWLVGMHLGAADRWGAARYGDRYWAEAETTLDRLSASPTT